MNSHLNPSYPFVVLHNIRADKLRKAAELGGMPMPSLAVLPTWQDFEGFGEITLIAKPEMADPSVSKDVHLFSADVYSPRVPEAEWLVSNVRLTSLRKKLFPICQETSVYHADIEDAAERGREHFSHVLTNSPAMKLLWLRENGFPAPKVKRVPKPLEEFVSSNDRIVKYHRENPSISLRNLEFSNLVKDAIEEYRASIIRAGAEPGDIGSKFFDEDGLILEHKLYSLERDRSTILEDATVVDTHEFKKSVENAVRAADLNAYNNWAHNWAKAVCYEARVKIGNARFPYTLQNVLKAMQREAVQGSEKGATFSLGKARSKSAISFSSLSEATLHSNLIQHRKNFLDSKSILDRRFGDICAGVFHFYDRYTSSNPYSNQMSAMDDLSETLFDYFTSKDRSPEAMQKALEKNGYKGVDDINLQDILDFANDLENCPVEYFEAKIRRSVSISEFVAAAIPDDAPEDIVAILAHFGIEHIERYQLSDRNRVVSKLAQTANATYDTGEFFRPRFYKGFS